MRTALRGIISIAAFAQQAQQPRQRGRGMMVTLPESWSARLKLNADQTAKIKAAGIIGRD